MAGRKTELPDESSSPASAVTPGPERLTLVRAAQPPVFRTFADAVQTERSGPVWRRRHRRMPAGLVHAAELQGHDSLCGRALETLHEFGRSRHAFERFDETLRCPACDVVAGRPTT